MSGPAATVAIGAILLGAALFAYVRSTHGAPARQRLVRVRVKQTGATLTVSPADGIVRVAGGGGDNDTFLMVPIAAPMVEILLRERTRFFTAMFLAEAFNYFVSRFRELGIALQPKK